MAKQKTTKAKTAARKDVNAELKKLFERVKLSHRQEKKKRKQPLPKYEDHVVCFMDLLGFRQRVERMSRTDARKEIAKLDSLMRTVVTPADGDPELFRITANYFSDCICFACSLANVDLKWVVEKLFYFVLHILHVQGELLFHDVLVRGAIVVDKHFSNDRLIFSRAQIRAYDLESKKVVFPMILVDKSVPDAILRAAGRKQRQPYPWGMKAFESEVADLFGLWAEDEAGRSFVNYLGFWTELDDDYEIRPFFEKHRALIIAGAKQFRNKPEILAKYRWMARYHNAYAQKLFSNYSELQIADSAFVKISLPDKD